MIVAVVLGGSGLPAGGGVVVAPPFGGGQRGRVCAEVVLLLGPQHAAAWVGTAP